MISSAMEADQKRFQNLSEALQKIQDGKPPLELPPVG